MKTILVLSTMLTLVGFSVAFSQEPDVSHYFDERQRGDDVAEPFRAAFELSVCKTAISAYCPSANLESIKNISTCSTIRNQCRSPTTIVEKRVISKYGIGATSANRDVLPMISRALQLLAAIEEDRKSGGTGITDDVEKRIPYIAMLMKTTDQDVETRLKNFFSARFPNKLSLIKIDYWGYFQQGDVQRPEFISENGLSTLELPFRFCSNRARFVDESGHILADILFAAIRNKNDNHWSMSSDAYETQCNQLPDEPTDFIRVKKRNDG